MSESEIEVVQFSPNGADLDFASIQKENLDRLFESLRIPNHLLDPGPRISWTAWQMASY